jgi:hypothetical protein
LHLLFPLTLCITFPVLLVIPLLIAKFSPPPLSSLAELYLQWCLPVLVAIPLLLFNWMQKRLLAPYVALLERQHESVLPHDGDDI